MPARPLRVLMTADAVGGIWTYALDLAHALAPHGVEIVLVTFGAPPTTEQQAAASAIPNLALIPARFALEWMDNPWADVERAGTWLLDLESRVQPDIVHLNGYAHGALPFRAPVLVAGHSCMLSWADAISDAIDPLKLRTYFEHVAPGIRAADLVVAPSGTMLDSLQKHYGPLARTRVIYNGRRAGIFEARRKEPFIFTAGRLWDRAKNVDTLASIAPRLPWPSAAAGADTIDEPGVRFAHPGLRTLGQLDAAALADWLGRASIFVLPARYEPFGLLPLEAAMSGCALVLGDIPSLREVWGDAADFVPPDDGEALARALASLIASPRLIAERAAAARKRSEKYSSAEMASEYLEAYAGAIGSRTPEGVLRCAL